MVLRIQCTTLLARLFFFFQLSFLFKCVLWFFLFTCFFLVFFFTHWMPPLLIVVSFIPPGFSTGCCILHYPISDFHLSTALAQKSDIAPKSELNLFGDIGIQPDC